ncbi:AraC family transcriptional regulator [Paenibacillus mucilaginosus]|uniref:AraC family transcriptional regulator n=2 Tax=Paenibacillus mucilaginosus TaxID=61624 RepID=H6NP59_9BACL|nr:AraC family transcriptional regulator [Paenibacillus mucilaginosus]AFC31133.1 AraC family transcriptional regulator [Paenibacillus mucilaginosus 3016]MCG7211966.1 AraC family transcriptional regulator [Paenibacillus mucilaginosus]WDM25044.1 helix-turn-helix transcriptional regulator [Paenibacillus mucilaginosus]WFA19715.1 AraC family transcriptional regulator [Paenibacillus mucilaginosus]
MKKRIHAPEDRPLRNGPLLSSDSLGWEHISLSKWQGVPPQEAFESSLSRHLIVIHTTPGPVHVHERGDGLNEEGVARPGNINVFSAGEMSYCRWEEELSFLRLELDPAFVQEIAGHSEFVASGGRIELNHKLRTSDPKLFHLSQWLLDELQSEGAGGKLYTDSLVRLLTVHLLQNYTSTPRKQRALPRKMSAQQVSRAIEYMHAHIERDISLEELAAVAHMSQSHLSRLFKQATGLSPHQYFIAIRVEKAKSLIQSRSLTLAEIASTLGFTDQSHFHRHFKRITGLSPREFLLTR